MTNHLEELIEKADAFLRFLDGFYQGHEAYNLKLIADGISRLRTGGFDDKFMEKVRQRDEDVSTFPYHVARHLLEDVTYNPMIIQALLERVRDFQKYIHFEGLGIFLSEAMRKVLLPDRELVLETGNTSAVHVPRFYFSHGFESSYPWSKQEELFADYREKVLISHLASRLTVGKVTIQGNVGAFFAQENQGAEITLEGECGWRPCYDMKAGSVTINGIAGHDLAAYADGAAKIAVNGTIRSIGGPYTTAFSHEIYNDGILLPKESLSVSPALN